jgi:hypothetical protein
LECGNKKHDQHIRRSVYDLLWMGPRWTAFHDGHNCAPPTVSILVGGDWFIFLTPFHSHIV